ncbi:MAG: hypothetical protein ABTQ34_08335 [Bdellovibrionales bacterium]
MFSFDPFVARHGEVVAQAIIENFERYQGIELDASVPLEVRWRRLVEDASPCDAETLAA